MNEERLSGTALLSPKTGQKSQTNEPSSGKPFFENLDALRFLSFLAVFLFHVKLYEWVAGFTMNPVVLVPLRVLCSGGWGVTFFFTLSGFLITWLLLVEIKKNTKVNVGAFYMRRVLRIWPLYALVIFTGMVLLPIGYQLLHQELYFDYNRILYAFFLSNYGVLALDPAFNSIRSYPLIMNITWSVSIEEQFYLVWPLAFLLPERLRRWVPLSFILISVIAAFALAPDHAQLYSSSLTRIGEIAVGAFIAMVAFKSPRFLNYIIRMPRLAIVLIYLLAFLLIYLSFRMDWSALATYGLHMSGSILFAGIILEQNFSERSFFKFGCMRRASFLGKISYGLYMLHPIAMLCAAWLLKLLLHQPAPVSEGPVYMITAFGMTVGGAWVSYHTLERPFLKLKDRFGFVRNRNT